MKKYSKYIILSFCIILLLVSICFVPIRASKLIPFIEEQVAKELGIDVHIERLILRTGPNLKAKVPIMHLMYADGQKFAQLDNVKFFIPWNSIIKNNPRIAHLNARKLTVRVNSDDKYLENLLKNLKEKDFKDIPNIRLKEYQISYFDKIEMEKYSLEGHNFESNKLKSVKNIKIKTAGTFNINSIKHITYDLNIVPQLNLTEIVYKPDLKSFIERLKELDFYSDIIADIKFYKTQDRIIQASGFINIDNISILDSEKKMPKSFVYLTLWGDKASILSNIYTSLNMKVCVEGMINNSQKPVIDLKVKTDEIEIKDLYDKLRIVSDFSHIKDIKDIDGTINANFTLKGDLNKIKSNGYLKINNAKFLANGVKLDKINSEIDFSNNTVNLKKAVGYVNNSPIIAKGYLNKNINIELLMNKVELKYLCPDDLGIKNGLVSLIANISGTLDKPIHKENLLIENLKLQNQNVDLSMEYLKFDTNKSDTAYINNLQCKTTEIELIKIPSLKILVNTDSIKLPDTSIFLPNSKITMKGEVVNYNNSEMNYVLSFDGFINSKDLARFSSNSVRYPVKFVTNGNKNVQNANLQVLLEKTDIFDEPSVLNLIAKKEKNSLKIDELSLNSLIGKFSSDLKSNVKGNKKIIITGIVEDLKSPTLKNIRVFVPQLLNINIYDTLLQAKGDLFLNGSLKAPEIIGQLNIQTLFNQSLQLALNNCTIDFNKNNAVINAPQLKIGDSSLSLNGLVSTDISKSILFKILSIKSKFINTDTLLMYKDSPVLKLYPLQIFDGKFYSERIISNIYGSQVYLSAFTSDFTLNNDILTFKNIASELFNGKIMGSLSYNLHDEHITSDIMARGVSAEPIFNIISTRKDSVSGIMDFDSNLKGELTSKQSLAGNIKFLINNGRMSTLGKLEHLLYAQNVVADHMLRTSLSVVSKAITLKDTGLFKYMRGDITLDKGIAKVNMIQTQGPHMALYINGDYNITNDFAKLTVLGRLSDDIIAGLGAFGDFSFNKLMIMLTGENNKKNTIVEDIDKLPQLPVKNTKEFRSIINGIIDKPASVVQFNWISYSEKSLRQKDVPINDTKLPEFLDNIPY